LVVDEPYSETLRHIVREDPEMVVWWGTPVECISAAAKTRRMGKITADDEREVRRRLDDATGRWGEISPSEDVRKTAKLLLRRHPLSAADALQLAAALIWCSNRPEEATIVCVDKQLREAADAEGFTVLPLSEEFASISGKK